MHRRTFLGTTLGAGVTGLAGCLSGSDDEMGPVVLEKTEEQGRLREARSQFDFPTYGEPFPAFAAPDPIQNVTVDTGDLDTIQIVFGFFGACPEECLWIAQGLAEVQRQVNDAGFGNEVTFLALTWDPARDTVSELEDFATLTNVDMDAGNWHFLRPEDNNEAQNIANDKLGYGVERLDDEAETRGGAGAYDYLHRVHFFLVNPDGTVERFYRDENPDVDQVVGDIEAIAEAYA